MFVLIHRSLVVMSFACLGLAQAGKAQDPSEQQSSGAIQHRMQELGVLGSVLYLAAHPDDENTRLISYLSNGVQARTGYLSLTRGDGGQNLIGPELGDGLGVLRTQELLQARRIDGGEQFFTRAVDFGYSKNPEETLGKWGRREVLADVVRVLRTFRPDVIVTRFATDGSGGHGHHTASALLAQEAFDVAADPSAFPEQIAEGLKPWQAKRLFFNASTWWNRDLASKVEEDPSHWVKVDVGGFDPLLGASYNELAGRSRSQHKSQGFGSSLARGSQLEYLRLDKGAALERSDIFDGVAADWSRVEGGGRVAGLVEELIAGFDPSGPEHSFGKLSELISVLEDLEQQLPSGETAHTWVRHHLAGARELALQVGGTVLEVQAASPTVARGDEVGVVLTGMQRSAGSFFELDQLEAPLAQSHSIAQPLPWNEALDVELLRKVEADAAIDQPYWLAAPHGTLYDPVGSGHLGIEPASRSRSMYRARLALANGRFLDVERPLMHTWVERVDGQRTRPAVITPVASIVPLEPVVLVREEGVTVAVEVESLTDALDGQLEVDAPRGWTVEGPAPKVLGLAHGDLTRFEIRLRRTETAEAGLLRFALTGSKGRANQTMHVIDYPHILPQVWYSPAQVKLVPVEVKLPVANVGYIKGAGDDLPHAMQRLGLQVEFIDPASAEAGELARFDAIVVGIRAYNAVPAMARVQAMLMDYVHSGGTVLVQYNTASRDMVLDPQTIGPYPFSLTRGRVTVEEAHAKLLDPQHALLNVPNQIGQADFDGWVQERGLYFAGERDARYESLISWSDPGEAPLDGALITCEYGAGRFTYTGISLFRQLPAGVPGAYRLLANLLARRSAR